MKKKKTTIYLTGFLFSFSLAITSYINSSFLENYLNRNYIGIIFALASILTIWSMLEMPRILNFLGNRTTLLLSNTVSFGALLVLALSEKSSAILPAFIVYFIATNFIIASLDIFIEDFSVKGGIGKFRGFYLGLMNLAWVMAQLVSGFVADDNSFRNDYYLAAIITALVSLILVFSLHGFQDPKYTKVPVSKTIRVFIKNKNISKIYFINLILKFFFAWMVIYTPIYLHEHLGFEWEKIGIIFTIMLIPFVLIDFPLGRLSDKIGEKKLLATGFLISAFATMLIPLVQRPELLALGIILFLTRVGAATIEVMSESYFFKEISERNADEISFFRNTQPVSYIIAPLLATPILLLVPSFKYLFFILGAVLLLGLFLTLRLKDVK